MNIWKDVDPKRVTPEKFLVSIEISKGMKNKYELDKQTGRLLLDRILYTSTHYPANYGFIPHTYCGDHDPLDVLVLCSCEIVPMAILDCKAIGVLIMTDQGEPDEKIIAVPIHDPDYNQYNDINELPRHIQDEIKHFFSVYKQLEGKHTEVKEVHGAEVARKVIQDCIDLFEETFCK